MPDPVRRALRSRAVAFCAALLCLAALYATASSLFPRQIGVDFYQFWGVPIAKATGLPHSPYVDAAGYARVLNERADATNSGKLKAVNSFRRNLEPMGTPLLYAAFSFFPPDYLVAQTLFTVILYATTGLAVFLLARLRGVGTWWAIGIAAIVEITFNPFMQDVKVGNVNSLQLLFMVVLLFVAVRRRYSGNALVDGLFVGSLAVFVIFKPNTLWVAAMLALHYGVTAGLRRLAAGVAVGAALAVLSFAIGAAYFGTPRAWLEWLQLARGLDGSGLPLTLEHGNLAVAMVLAKGSSAAVLRYGIFIAVALGLGLLIVASTLGRRLDLVVPTLRAVLADPWFALSAGVLLTFATSPMVWPHYHLFALIPIFWLFRRRGRWDAGTWGASFCLVGWSRPVLETLAESGYQAPTVALVVFAWVALLPGAYLYVVEKRRERENAAVASA